MAEDSLARLQSLLRDLFQYDYADLDFGIYRLLRLKRGEVEAFLTEQLPRRADEVFKGAAGDVHAALDRELAGLAERVRQEIDADALTPTGDIKAEYRQRKARAARELIAAYDAKRKQVQEIQVREDLKAASTQRRNSSPRPGRSFVRIAVVCVQTPVKFGLLLVRQTDFLRHLGDATPDVLDE